MELSRSIGVIAPFALFAALAGLAPSAMAQSFTIVAPGSGAVTGISADGRSASGVLANGRGFLWNLDSGRNDFGNSISQNTRALGISGDGLTVVGGGPLSENGLTAFRWSAAGGYQNLGTTQDYTSSMASDANHDGSIIVGTLDRGVGTTSQAFRWTQSGGMQAIGSFGSRANAISGDGNVVVGDLGSSSRAFTWTQAGGTQFLPALGGTGNSYAFATNFTGNIVVGLSGNGLPATMWTNGVAMELPMTIPDGVLTPHGVSDDGSVVVGVVSAGLAGRFAGIWTASTGIIRLDNYLTSNGVTIPAGVNLEVATSISADGRTFGGYTSSGAISVGGWVATVPAPGVVTVLALAGLFAARRRRQL